MGGRKLLALAVSNPELWEQFTDPFLLLASDAERGWPGQASAF